jgi:hypothetical protein
MDSLLIPTFLCPKPWASMTGNEATRFCSYCKKHVHNLEVLSVGERLALLASPAASVCSRYQLAIRRPAKGREESYRSHLLKYGTGVALAGSVLAVLWEWQGNGEKQRYYKAAGISPAQQGMPRHYYDEHQVVAMGMAVCDFTPDPLKPEDSLVDQMDPAPLELKLDPAEVDRLIEQAKPQYNKDTPVVPLRSE